MMYPLIFNLSPYFLYLGYEDRATNELILNVNLVGVNPLGKKKNLTSYVDNDENENETDNDDDENDTVGIYENCQVWLGLGLGGGVGGGA